MKLIAIVLLTATAFAQAPTKTPAEAEAEANAHHQKVLAARQRLETNPDFIEWMTEKQNEDNAHIMALAMRNLEKQKIVDAAKKTAPPATPK